MPARGLQQAPGRVRREQRVAAARRAERLRDVLEQRPRQPLVWLAAHVLPHQRRPHGGELRVALEVVPARHGERVLAAEDAPDAKGHAPHAAVHQKAPPHDTKIGRRKRPLVWIVGMGVRAMIGFRLNSSLAWSVASSSARQSRSSANPSSAPDSRSASMGACALSACLLSATCIAERARRAGPPPQSRTLYAAAQDDGMHALRALYCYAATPTGQVKRRKCLSNVPTATPS